MKLIKRTMVATRSEKIEFNARYGLHGLRITPNHVMVYDAIA